MNKKQNSYYHHLQKLEGPLHYRGWWNFGKWTFGWSFNLHSNFCHLQWGRGIYGDNEYSFTIAIPPIAIWLHLELPFDKKSECYEYGITIHHQGLWLKWNHDDTGLYSNRPFSFNKSFYLLDWLFGRMVYSDDKDDQKIHNIIISMPEKDYDATIITYTSKWKRPRLPWFNTIMKRHDIEIPEGIPYSPYQKYGGEGPDRIYSITTSRSLYEVKKDILEERRQYGLIL